MMNKNKHRKNKADKVVFVLLVFLLVASELVIVYLSRNKEKKVKEEPEPINIIGTYDAGDDFYYQKLSKKVILLAGLNGDDVQYVLLIVADEDNKTLQPIQISRDILCEHNVLNEFGKIINQKVGPIRDSYIGAADSLVGLVNVKDAVTKLMCNIRIDYYMSINLLAADKITEIYDGIDVKLYEDYVDLNAEYIKDKVVTIRPENAIDFIIGNEAIEGSKRIEGRINVFVNGFYDLNQLEYQNDSSFFSNKFAEVSRYCLFNSNDFIDYAAKTIWFKHLPIITIESEKTSSDHSFNENDIERICIENIYK